MEIIVSGTPLSLEAIRGDTVPSSDPRSPLVIEEVNSQFREFTSSVIVQVEEELSILIIGTSNGLLLKVVTSCIYDKLCYVYYVHTFA